MSNKEKLKLSVSSLLQEVDTTRKRLEQALDRGWTGDSAIHAAALAEEVGRLCRQASFCDNNLEAKPLLDVASRRLDELQILLGVH